MKAYFTTTILFFCLAGYAQLTVGVIEYDTVQTQKGYNLFYPLLQNNVYLIDNCGRIVNQWNDTGFIPGSSVELLEDGNLLKTSSLFLTSNSSLSPLAGAGDKVHLKDWDNNVLWEYTIADSKERMHHDIKSMPNGNVLILAWEKKTAEEAFEAGRDTVVMNNDNEIYPDFVVEIKPLGIDSGEVVWRWNAWDHMIQDFDETKDNYGVVADHPELININYPSGDDAKDWLHVNAIDYNESLDQIMISSPGFNEVWIIDHSTTAEEAAGHTGGNSGKGGDLIYRWGNPAAYGKGDSTQQKLFFQHDPHWVEQGLDDSDVDFGKILVFNNLAGMGYSTVNIFAPIWNEETNQYQKNDDGTFAPQAFDYTYQAENPSDLYSFLVSGAQKLPNGNMLICSGIQSTVFEVNAANEIVWQYVNPVRSGGGGVETQGAENPNGSLLFRFNRYAPDFEGFQGKELTPGEFIELEPDGQLCPDFVSMQDVFLNSIKVYPNPAQYELIIEHEQPLQSIVLYNAAGEKVTELQTSNIQMKLPVQNMEPGYYLLVIGNDIFKKIIIQ